MKTWFQVTLLAMIAAALGCNSTGMSGSDSSKPGEKGEKSGRLGTELGSEREGEEDSEDQPSDQPVQVSGAFLTCVAVEGPGGDTNSATDLYGCVIERQSVRVPNQQFSAKYLLTALPDRTSVPEAKIEQADDLSLWHVFIEVPSNKTTVYEVTAEVQWTTAVNGVTSEVLKAELKTNGKLNAIRFGKDREFHIGNNDYSGGTCKQRINTTPLYGTTLALKLIVKESNARAAVYIKGICGVDYKRAAYVRVRDAANNVLKNVEIARDTPELTFTLTGLAAGSYTLEFVSLLASNNDHDDYVVGDVTVISDKPVSGDLP